MVRVDNYSIEITTGRCKLRLHKLGQSERQDPWKCFPDHPGPAARMDPSVEQLELDGIIFPIPISWVIGHYGNSGEGLRAIYLQAPAEGEPIRAWRAVIKVYDASEDELPKTISPPNPPPPADIPDPEIHLRDQRTEEEHGSTS